MRRKPGRASYDAELVDRILDEALICHLGFAVDGQPQVIPTIHARDGSTLYLHGSKGSRALGALSEGAQCCVSVTLVDGIVLARSALHHSLNYRSAIVFGTARRVADPAEKARALEVVVEHIAPGRTGDARRPAPDELEATEVLAIELEEASAKVREGGPIDAAEDMGLPVWAGQLPLTLEALEPAARPRALPGGRATRVPAQLVPLVGRRRHQLDDVAARRRRFRARGAPVLAAAFDLEAGLGEAREGGLEVGRDDRDVAASGHRRAPRSASGGSASRRAPAR